MNPEEMIQWLYSPECEQYKKILKLQLPSQLKSFERRLMPKSGTLTKHEQECINHMWQRELNRIPKNIVKIRNKLERAVEKLKYHLFLAEEAIKEDPESF